MDVSVIIPTFDRAAVLGRAIASVMTQTSPAREIVVVDDGSSDHTERVVRGNFPAVHYLWQPNRGVSRARNVGIEATEGEWIAFLDSDDEWLPEKLQSQSEALQRDPDFLVCHTDEIWIKHGSRVTPLKKHAKSGGRIFQDCLPLCAISPSSVVIHRSVFAEVGEFDETLPVCEDYDLWLRICARYTVLYLPQMLVRKYGGHVDQLSRRYQAMDRFRIRALEKIVFSTHLSRLERKAALEMLLRKIFIYLNGAKKRNKVREVDFYTRKRTYYHEKLVQQGIQTLPGRNSQIAG